MQRTVLGSFLALSTLASLVLCGGCSPKSTGGPAAQSPERQSEAEYDVARDYFYKGQPRAALDHVRKAIELNDENEKALYFASVIHLSFCAGVQGFRAPDCNVAEAEKFARQALKVKEDFRDARNTLGQILILEKKYREAMEVLEPLTKDAAYTEPHLAWGNYGWAQVEAGQLDEGIASLKNSITNPRFCVGHYRLGVAYERKGDFAQAETSFTNAVTVDSPDCQNLQEAWEHRGRVRMRLGKVDEARADFEKCRAISADSPTGKSCANALSGTSAPAASAAPP